MQKLCLSEPGLKRISVILLLILMCSWGSVHSAPPKSGLTTSKTVLVLGDSLSAEYGIARGSGWVALLQERIEEKKLNVRVVNGSISGDTTSGGLDRISALLEKHHPSTVVIELGANDGLRGLPVTNSQKNVLSIISKIQAAKANVLLVGMQIPPNYGPEYTKQFAEMYKNIAKQKKVALVPFLLDGVADKPEMFQTDRLHLVAAAHPQILNNIWPHLLPLISR